MVLRCKSIAYGLVVVGLTVTSSALAQDCTPKHKFATVEPGFITVAAVAYAPYSTIDEAGNVGGVDGDLLHAIAEAECLKVKTVPVDAAAAIQYVLSGKADTASGDWYRTAEREKILNLSEPLYLDQMSIYSKDGWGTIADLEGKKVGTLQGDLWDADLKKVLGDNLSLYPTAVGLVQDLTAGRIVAFIEGAAFGAVAKSKGELKDIKIVNVASDERVKASVGPGQGCFVIARANTDLLEAVNATLVEMKGNGKLEAVVVKHGLPASAAQTGKASVIK